MVALWEEHGWCAIHPKELEYKPEIYKECELSDSVPWKNSECQKAFQRALKGPQLHDESEYESSSGSVSPTSSPPSVLDSARALDAKPFKGSRKPKRTPVTICKATEVPCECARTTFKPGPCYEDVKNPVYRGPVEYRTHTGRIHHVEFCIGWLKFPRKMGRGFLSGSHECPRVDDDTALFELHEDAPDTFVSERRQMLRSFILDSEAYARGDYIASLEQGFHKLNLLLADMTPLESRSKSNPILQRCAAAYSSVALVKGHKLLELEHKFTHPRNAWLAQVSLVSLQISNDVHDEAAFLFSTNAMEVATVNLSVDDEWYLYMVPDHAYSPTIMEKFILRGLEEELSLEELWKNVLDNACTYPGDGVFTLARINT